MGTFPSYKMDRGVRYESHYEMMMYFILELDGDVKRYEAHPFTVIAPFDDGSHHSYTPDIQAWCVRGRDRLYEVKGEDYVDEEHTKQQRQIGQAWSEENDHDFIFVSSADLRADALWRNAQILWDERWRDVSPPLIYQCRALVATLGADATLAALAAWLGAQEPSLPSVQVIYSLLFHHHLETNLRCPLSAASPLWIDLNTSNTGT